LKSHQQTYLKTEETHVMTNKIVMHFEKTTPRVKTIATMSHLETTFDADATKNIRIHKTQPSAYKTKIRLKSHQQTYLKTGEAHVMMNEILTHFEKTTQRIHTIATTSHSETTLEKTYVKKNT